MKRSSYQIRAQKFVRQIAPFLAACTEPDEYEEAVCRYNFMYHRKVICAHGLTRIALITSDYVIKFEYGDMSTVFGGCEDELSLYEQAEQEGFDYLLARIEKFSYLDSNFYIMPRIHGLYRKEENATEYMTEQELDWCDEHGLSDLHNGNYGWKNGHVVLIDYAARC